MELRYKDSFFVLVNGDESLWIDRMSEIYVSKKGVDFEKSPAPCLGKVYGYIGRLQFEGSQTHLVFIRQRTEVGSMKGSPVYKINSVLVIPLRSESDVLMEPLEMVQQNPSRSSRGTASKVTNRSRPSASTESNIGASSQRNLVKVRIPSIAGTMASTSSSSSTSRRNDKQDKSEKRTFDEFHKLFSESDSFYFSSGYDITNSIQRAYANGNMTGSLWNRADSRFVWNHYMMIDMISQYEKDPKLESWIIPVMQGFFEQNSCVINEQAAGINSTHKERVDRTVFLTLISRRSRFRAGTRYLKRGVDENGKVANYVETEQIVNFKTHYISFVMTRGSIPIFWSQPGFRYRPPPRLERSFEDNLSAFKAHFQEECLIYGPPVVAINLVDKGGKERVLGDAYLEYILTLNSPELNYVTFDFHDSCRGMKFENVSVLINKLTRGQKEELTYCWADNYGIVLKQEKMYRINCVDCLDRTNVVQTVLAKHVLMKQMSKLGLVIPESGLNQLVTQKHQTMWANNGDTISKQYAGTNALKGDYTRTGERRLAGLMKDGMNSANRYYRNRFKDIYRQTAIDIMLGIRQSIPTYDDIDPSKGSPDEKEENTPEQILSVVQDAKKCIVPKSDLILGAWGLVDSSLDDADSVDVDSILILTHKHYYITEYDTDSMTPTVKVDLTNVASIEVGFENLCHATNSWNVFHNEDEHSTHISPVPCLRINYYKTKDQIAYHQFRSSTYRFFNNIVILIQHPDEMLDALKMIADAIKIAASTNGKEVEVIRKQVISRMESTKTSLPEIASSLVNRYLTFRQSDSEACYNDATSHKPSMSQHSDRAGFKLTKLRSNEDSVPGEDEVGLNMDQFGKRKGTTVTEATLQRPDKMNQDGLTSLNQNGRESLKIDLINRADNSTANNVDITKNNLIEATISPEALPRMRHHIVQWDLTIPSCGIIFLSISPTYSTPRQGVVLLGSRIGCEDDLISLSGSRTPLSPQVALDYLHEKNRDNPTLEDQLNSRFQKHRFSLPTQSLGLVESSLFSPVRAVTPEIKITEDESSTTITGAPTPALQPQGKLNFKGISKSSEDMSKINLTSQVKASPPGKKLSLTYNLLQAGGVKLLSGNSETRSNSDQDIFSRIVNMKGSHSDTALRTGNRLLRLTQAGVQPKKDLVMAPLGKIAKGMQNIGANLDPRKLRGPFKVQGRKEQETVLTEEEKEALALLEKRKQNCLTLIIDT